MFVWSFTIIIIRIMYISFYYFAAFPIAPWYHLQLLNLNTCLILVVVLPCRVGTMSRHPYCIAWQRVRWYGTWMTKIGPLVTRKNRLSPVMLNGTSTARVSRVHLQVFSSAMFSTFVHNNMYCYSLCCACLNYRLTSFAITFLDWIYNIMRPCLYIGRVKYSLHFSDTVTTKT